MHLLSYRDLHWAPFRHSSWLPVEAVREPEGAASAARESEGAVDDSRESKGAVDDSRESEGGGLGGYWEGTGGQ